MAADCVHNDRLIGKLYINNIVSTYCARLYGVSPEVAQRKMNIEAVTFSVQSKLAFDVFPASVSKSRIFIAGSPAFDVEAHTVYPLRKKRKLDDADDDADGDDEALRRRAPSAKAKKAKLTLNVARHSEMRQYVTATDSTFHSNENVVAGGKSIVCNILTAYMFLRRLSHDMACHMRLCNLKTQNIVCSADMGFELNLDWIMSDFEARGLEVNYTPEEFSGCSVKIYDIVYVVFASGKIVATGIKQPENIEKAERDMHDLFTPYQRGKEPACLDTKRSFARDVSTLGHLRTVVLGRKPGRRNTAAARSSRKVASGLHAMMKQLGQTTNS